MLDDLVAARKVSWKKLMKAIDAENDARIALKDATLSREAICSEDEAAASRLHKYVSDLAK